MKLARATSKPAPFAIIQHSIITDAKPGVNTEARDGRSNC